MTPEQEPVFRREELLARHVGLRPLTPEDYDFLFVLLNHPDLAFTGRLAGTSLNPDELRQLVWRGVLTQYIVSRLDTRGSIGLVSAYNVDFRQGYIYLAAYFLPELENSGWILEGPLLLINLLFRHYRLRKIYMESTEYNFEKFRSGVDRFFSIEGRLVDHVYLGGRYWDSYTLAVTREAAEREIPRLLGRP